MKVIEVEGLLPGDIILTARPGKLGKSIRRLTSGEVSHAMICVQAASFIDSTMNGVQASNIQREYFEDDEVLFRFRLREPASPETMARVVDYARTEIGARYATADIVGVKSPVRGQPSKRQFCSRLVARAFAKAGIELLPDTDYCSPEDLRTSPHLVEIPLVTRWVSQEEMEWRRSEPDLINATHAAQNKMLRAARAFDPEVETMQDLLALVRRDEATDAMVDEAQRRSGFLDLWRSDVTKHPWRYDPALIEQVGLEKSVAVRCYCLLTVKEAYTGGVTDRRALNASSVASASTNGSVKGTKPASSGPCRSATSASSSSSPFTYCQAIEPTGCIPKGPIKDSVIRQLEAQGASFVDVGMGLELSDGSLGGILRVTASTPGKRDHVHDGRISFAAAAEDGVYDSNIQVAELNALNAALAVIKWKKIRGFYRDLEREMHSTFTTDGNLLLNSGDDDAED